MMRVPDTKEKSASLLALTAFWTILVWNYLTAPPGSRAAQSFVFGAIIATAFTVMAFARYWRLLREKPSGG
jgi:hypothetical protein